MKGSQAMSSLFVRCRRHKTMSDWYVYSNIDWKFLLPSHLKLPWSQFLEDIIWLIIYKYHFRRKRGWEGDIILSYSQSPATWQILRTNKCACCPMMYKVARLSLWYMSSSSTLAPKNLYLMSLGSVMITLQIFHVNLDKGEVTK